LFESLDGGRRWSYFAHLGSGDDLMLENIVLDPSNASTIYVGGWSLSGSGGGFFISRDGGRSWNEPVALRGKSIQALALANSDPRILIAGALDGLYRSTDSGETWERISPAGDPDLKNFESVAVDPRDPKIIYAGTWHLPWKSTDGGATWSSIKQGVIDDSDVFSIILDHSNPETVFASACSGIYKSEDGGSLFRKVQGIPGTARRTRVLRQDPNDSQTVYAGTTEGLFKSTDGGKTFQRITPSDFILNDVLLDPRDSRRVLIATDRGGVFASDDAGATFHPANDGFSQRQITSVVADPSDPSDLYAGVVNDKEFGGVFHAHNGVWSQMSEGLGGLDIFDLALSGDGQLVAASNRGLFLFDAKARRWQPSRISIAAKPLPPPSSTRGKGQKAAMPKPSRALMAQSIFTGRVRSLALANRRWYAATDAGILYSDNEGVSWSGGAIEEEKSFFSVAAHDQTVAAASVSGVWVSADYAQHWLRQPLPPEVSRVYSVTITQDDEIWLSTREGAFRWIRRSSDEGAWERRLNGLPSREVTSIREQGALLLVAAAGNTVYVSRDRGQSWKAAAPASDFEVTGAVLQGKALYMISRRHGMLTREADALAVTGLQ
jgi:photosystem II stability/assembly factor-like uncharacterized protein